MNADSMFRDALAKVVNDLNRAGRSGDASTICIYVPDIIRTVKDVMNDNQVVFYQP